MKNMALVVTLGLLASACATDGPTASVPSSFVGADVAAFTAQYGPANHVTALDDGSILARFIIADNRSAPRSVSGSYSPRMVPPTAPTGVRPQFVGSAHGETGSGVSIEDRSARYQQCTFDVTISASGIVQAVTTTQETCNHITS